jgi:hypothetical protein
MAIDTIAKFGPVLESLHIKVNSLVDIETQELNILKKAEEDRLRSERLKDIPAPIRPQAQRGRSAPSKQSNGENDNSFNLFSLFFNPFNNLLASFTAFGLAIAGLRGWEMKAIDKLKTGIKSLSGLVMDGIKGLRNAVLVKYFGFTPEGQLSRNTRGQFTSGVPISQQIAQRISDLRARALRVFGLGIDGKPIAVRGADGRFAGTSIIGKVTSRIAKLLSPLRAVSTGISNFISGTGKAIFKSSIFKGAGSFVKAVGKILKPLGIIFSAWEGVNAFLDTEGTLYEKFSAGISEALGDFFGAPLDLLKDLGAWVIRKMGFDETADAVTNFSIEDKLTDLINGILMLPSNAIKWIKGLFDWNAEDEESADTNMISEIFNNTIEKLKSFFTDLFDFIPSLDEIKEGLISMLPSWMRPENVEEERARLEQELARATEQKNNAASKVESMEGQYHRGAIEARRALERKQSEIDDIQKQLAELPEARRGGIFNADSNGSPVMLHGQEAVIPLESSRGQQILETKTGMISSADAQKASAPIVLAPGGSNVNAPQTTNNVNNTSITYNSNPAGSLSRRNARAQ